MQPMKIFLFILLRILEIIVLALVFQVAPYLVRGAWLPIVLIGFGVGYMVYLIGTILDFYQEYHRYDSVEL